MSWEATAYVKELRAAPGTGEALTRAEKLVLFVLADYHNSHDRGAWPSGRAIATAALMSERHVWATLRSLVRKGVLVSERRTDGRGGRATNRYQFVGLDQPLPPPSVPPCAPEQSPSAPPCRDSLSAGAEAPCPPAQGGSVVPFRGAAHSTAHKPQGEPPIQPPMQPQHQPPAEPGQVWRREMGQVPTPAQQRRLAAWAAAAAAQGRPLLVEETIRAVAERGKAWGYFAAAMEGRLRDRDQEPPPPDGEAAAGQEGDAEAALEARARDIARQLQSDDLALCRRAAEGDRAALSALRRRFFEER